MKQNKKRLIAITGGIGSGKSVVLSVAEELGYPAFSADAFAKEIYHDKSVLEAVEKLFPHCVQNGAIDRRALAREVFSDEKKLAALNGATHPAIMEKLRSAMDAADSAAVFAEVPLLFEGGYAPLFDRVIVVMRPLAERVEAVARRDGATESEVLARIKNQYDYEKNRIIGHTVLYNEGDLATFRERAARAIREAAQDP